MSGSPANHEWQISHFGPRLPRKASASRRVRSYARTANRAESVHETLESDPVSTAILELFDDPTSEWTGTAGDLMKHLEPSIEDGIKKSSAWPKTPRAFSGRIRRLTTFLRESGVEITFHRRKGTRGQRLLTIARTATDLTASTATIASAEHAASMNQLDTAYSANVGENSGVAINCT
jgi:hypothetical protein